MTIRRLSWVILLALLSPSLAPSLAHAQLWSGVLSPARGINWTQAGIPGGPPDSGWTQCGATIAAYSGTATTINSALAACGANQFVLLGAGTFNLSTGINFPLNASHRVLRGAGANLTFIIFGASATASGCNGVGAFICANSSDAPYRGSGGAPHFQNWTSGYAQGATQITLDGLGTIVAGQSLLILNQCDTGYSGIACNVGGANDNNGYFQCATPWTSTGVGCNIDNESADGDSWRCATESAACGNNGYAWQSETVLVTAINAGGCGATCVSINPPLHHPNWAGGQSPQAVISQPITQDGVENLSMDGLADQDTGTQASGIYFFNCYQCWSSGVRVKDVYAWSFDFNDGANNLVQNSYCFGNPSSYGNNACIHTNTSDFNLFVNNISQQKHIGYLADGPGQADVVAYNYAADLYAGAGSANANMGFASDTHSGPGNDFVLFEGNEWGREIDDADHGGHANITVFRDFMNGWESCANGQCGGATAKNFGTNPMRTGFATRYGTFVGDVFGTPGYHNTYSNTGSATSIYQLGAGYGSQPDDTLSTSTSMFWDNWDAATNATRCNNSEVPTGAPTYPNSIPTLGCGGGTLPASFIYAAKPSWWPTATPWPPIGPDVSGGNVGQCTGALNTPGQQAGLPATAAGQCPGATLASAWAGHVNANPARTCADNMGILPDGTGSVQAFDPATCYVSGGGGGTPSFSFSPATPFGYGSLMVGASISQVFTVSNPGTANLIITLPFNTSGANAADFTIISNNCASGFGGVIAAGGSCTITIEFIPSLVGSETASLVLMHNAAGSPYTLVMTGTGTGAPPPPINALPAPPTGLVGVPF